MADAWYPAHIGSVATDLLLRTLEPNDERAFVRALALTAVRDPRFVHYYRPELAFVEYLRILISMRRDTGSETGFTRGGLSRATPIFLLVS
jgi:hypothetical protein